MSTRSLIIYAAAMWWLVQNQTKTPEEVRLDLLQRQIKAYRGMAEYCGTRVIALESKHTLVTNGSRTI